MKNKKNRDSIIEIKQYQILLSLFFLALTLRLIYFSQSVNNPLLYMPVLDEKYYINMGKLLASGDWLGGNKAFFMDPLYGYLLGAVFYVFGDNLTIVRLLQIFLDSLNVVMIYMIGRKVWDKRAACISAIFYALYTVAFSYTLLILKTTMALSMTLLFVILLFWVIKSNRCLPWYLLGLISALLIYLRANLILIVFLVLLFHYMYGNSGWRRFSKNSILLFAGLVTLLSLGLLRNYLVCDEFILLNTQGGRLFYSSNNPENLTGKYNVPSFSRPNPEDSEYDFHKEAERRIGSTLGPDEVSNYWLRETLRFLINNPRAVFKLLFNKLKGTFGNCEIPNNHSYYVSSSFSTLSRLPFPNFAFAIAIGIPGLIIGFIKKRDVIWLFIPILTVLITTVVFYTASRFRMPMVPFLLLGAGIWFCQMADWAKEKKFKKMIIFLAISIFLWTSSLLVPCPRKFGTEEFYLAKAYWTQKDLKKARVITHKGMELFPFQSRFKILMGMISLSENKIGEAIKYNLDAIKIDPNNSDAYNNMALIYLTLEKPEEALTYSRKAMLFQHNPEYIFTLARAHEKVGDIPSAVMNYERYLRESKLLSPMRSQAIIRLTGLKKQ